MSMLNMLSTNRTTIVTEGSAFMSINSSHFFTPNDVLEKIIMSAGLDLGQIKKAPLPSIKHPPLK